MRAAHRIPSEPPPGKTDPEVWRHEWGRDRKQNVSIQCTEAMSQLEDGMTQPNPDLAPQLGIHMSCVWAPGAQEPTLTHWISDSYSAADSHNLACFGKATGSGRMVCSGRGAHSTGICVYTEHRCMGSSVGRAPGPHTRVPHPSSRTKTTLTPAPLPPPASSPPTSQGPPSCLPSSPLCRWDVPAASLGPC